MSLQLNGTDGVTFNDGSEQWAAASPIGTKNLIINGNMQIAQRGTSVSGITGTGYYTVDRFYFSVGTAGTWTQTQDTDVPTGQGFSTSLKMQCTTANASLSANSFMQFEQKIEGQNIQHLKYGTANAEKVTASFWVKTNKTGTYVARLYTPSPSRAVHITFTIDSADTWEKKILTFNGDTSTSLVNSNAEGLRFTIWLVAGTNFSSGTQDGDSWVSYTAANSSAALTVNLADSTSNYINITGVQLEVGDTATPFEVMPYDMNLARCQRYYYLHAEGDTKAVGNTAMYNSSTGYVGIDFPVNMRDDPSIEVASPTNFRVFAGNGFSNATGVSLWSQINSTNGFITCAGLSRTQGHAGMCVTTNSACKLAFLAEL